MVFKITVGTGLWWRLWLRLRFGMWLGEEPAQGRRYASWSAYKGGCTNLCVCMCTGVCRRIKTFIHHRWSTLKITKECIVWKATSGIFCCFISVAASSMGLCGGVRRGLHAELVLERRKPSVTARLHDVFSHLTGWLALFVTSSLWLHACFWCDTRLFSKLNESWRRLASVSTNKDLVLETKFQKIWAK